MFCPKCKAILVLNRAPGMKECKRPNCGHSEDKGKEVITKRKQEDKEMVVTEGTVSYTHLTLPTIYSV